MARKSPSITDSTVFVKVTSNTVNSIKAISLHRHDKSPANGWYDKLAKTVVIRPKTVSFTHRK